MRSRSVIIRTMGNIIILNIIEIKLKVVDFLSKLQYNINVRRMRGVNHAYSGTKNKN